MSRKAAREAALQLLYEKEIGGGDEQTIENLIVPELGSPLDETDLLFMREMVDGTSAWTDELDERIQTFSVDWETSRMARVDLCILRLACFEVIHKGLPPAVAGNEAVELARKYSTEESGRFINGVLGNLLRAHEQEERK